MVFWVTTDPPLSAAFIVMSLFHDRSCKALCSPSVMFWFLIGFELSDFVRVISFRLMRVSKLAEPSGAHQLDLSLIFLSLV